MTATPAYDDLILSLELTLNTSFEGQSFDQIVATVQSRITELTPVAASEVEFDEASLERGMLQKMLAMLLGPNVALDAPVTLQ